jgi:cytochrome bd-type quinol oxidase subunit 2
VNIGPLSESVEVYSKVWNMILFFFGILCFVVGIFFIFKENYQKEYIGKAFIWSSLFFAICITLYCLYFWMDKSVDYYSVNSKLDKYA